MIKATLLDVTEMHSLGRKYASTLESPYLDEAATNIALVDEFIDKARLRQGFWRGVQSVTVELSRLNTFEDLLRARVEWFESVIEKET